MRRYAIVRVCLLAALCCARAVAADFSFYQFSDLHSPVPGSREVVAAATKLTSVRLAPYSLTAPRPGFAICTGDLCEFGYGQGAWTNFLGYFADWKAPLHLAPGNHDQTWWLLKPTLRSRSGGFPYGFDFGGCHFIALDSAGRGDPRPGFGLEELNWLERHLRDVKPETPLFIAFHHPLEGTEWSTPYDYERLLERLAGYNVAAFLVGHGHTAKHHRFADYDGIQGGSTFDGNAKPASAGNAGFMVYDVRGGRLRVAYKRNAEAEATLGLLDKSLAPLPVLPKPLIAEPTRDGTGLTVHVNWPGPSGAVGTVASDANAPGPLQRHGPDWSGTIDLKGAVPGLHVLRVRFTVGDRVALATREWTLPGGARIAWRTALPASVKAAVTVTSERVYVPAQDGVLYSLDRHDGHVMWQLKTGGELLGSAAVGGGQVFVGSCDQRVHATDAAGHELWRYNVAAPISAPLTLAGRLLLVAALDGTVRALDRVTGKVVWRTQAAEYAIESQPVVANDRVFVGAWDRKLHALALSDGQMLWSTVSASASAETGSARYYSPGDAPPTVVGDHVMVADRGYRLTSYDAATGRKLDELKGVAATAPTSNGTGCYVRRVLTEGGFLQRLAPDLSVTWSTDCALGYLPVPPVEAEGLVLTTSDRGLLSVLRATDGHLLWQWRLSPGLWHPGGAALRDGRVYSAGQNGEVLCLEPR